MFGAPITWLNNIEDTLFDAQGKIVEGFARPPPPSSRSTTTAAPRAPTASTTPTASRTPPTAPRTTTSTTTTTASRTTQSAATPQTKPSATTPSNANSKLTPRQAAAAAAATGAAGATAIATAAQNRAAPPKPKDDPTGFVKSGAYCVPSNQNWDYVIDMRIAKNETESSEYAKGNAPWGIRRIIQEEAIEQEELHERCMEECNADTGCFGFVAMNHRHDITKPMKRFPGDIAEPKYEPCPNNQKTCYPQCILGRTRMGASNMYADLDTINKYGRVIEEDFKNKMPGATRIFVHPRSFGAVSAEELTNNCNKL